LHRTSASRSTAFTSPFTFRLTDFGISCAVISGSQVERIEKPAGIAPTLERARRANEAGHAVLLEFITSEEIAFSHRRET
jgi:hypothetical protein